MDKKKPSHSTANTKFMSTKTMEKEGLTAGEKKKPVTKENLIKNSRDKFYTNLQSIYKENANAPEVSEPKKIF